ncbi:MAG: VWA domain-containing protein [Planctomycetota bacterium]|jgi:Ca-activated chloride channel family protein
MDIRFNQLDALHWLWVVLAVVAVMAVGGARRRRRLDRFARRATLARLAPGAGGARRAARAGLVVAALLALVAALLDPRWGLKYEEVEQQGIDVMVVLDVSRSMLAEDAAPSRLERAKQMILDLCDTLAGDRVGLVTFAGLPTLECPLTVDYGAVRLSLQEVRPRTAARGGSLLGDALRLAGESFTDEVEDYKAVIVFTDGEDHGSYPVEAARRLREERGIRVYTVGLGDGGRGARIPVETEGRRLYLTHDGQEVWSRMDADLLRELALAADGAFVPAGTRSVDFARIYTDRIEPVTKRRFESARIRRREARYQWFAGLALLLLLVESALTDGRTAAPGMTETGR